VYPIIPTKRARLPFCTELEMEPTTTSRKSTRTRTPTADTIPEATLTLPTDESPLDPETPLDPADPTADGAGGGNYGLNFCEQVFGTGSIRTTCADVCSFFLDPQTSASNIMACNKVCRDVARTTGSFTTTCSAIFTDILTDTGSEPNSGGGDGFATDLPELEVPTETILYETIWVDPTPTETIVDFVIPTVIEEESTTSQIVFDFPTAVEEPVRTTTRKKTTTTRTGNPILVVSQSGNKSTPTLIPILVAEQNNRVISAPNVDDPIIGRSAAGRDRVGALTIACVVSAALVLPFALL
jgi:hypothetical protein